MKEEEIKEIEDTLKVTKPYNELGSYNYFNCESIEKLLEENKSLQSQLKAKEEVVTKLKEWLEEMLNELKQNDVYDRTSYEMGQIIATECIIAKIEDLEILSKGENK